MTCSDLTLSDLGLKLLHNVREAVCSGVPIMEALRTAVFFLDIFKKPEG